MHRTNFLTRTTILWCIKVQSMGLLLNFLGRTKFAKKKTLSEITSHFYWVMLCWFSLDQICRWQFLSAKAQISILTGKQFRKFSLTNVSSDRPAIVCTCNVTISLDVAYEVQTPPPAPIYCSRWSTFKVQRSTFILSFTHTMMCKNTWRQ